jgi:hypothetical protein
MLGNGSSLPAVPFTNNLAGIFSGSDASDRYLEMTVQGLAPGDPPIQPRLRLLASPYSYLASKALNVSDNNVALRAGGNTFAGNQTITGGSIYMDNGAEIFAKNISGTYEDVFYPRWYDNATYLDYGSGGFHIRNDSFQDTMFMATNGDVGIGSTSPGQLLQVGDGNVTGTQGMIRLGSRTSTGGGASRVWDIGVPQTGDVTSGVGYSFVVHDVGLAAPAQFMVQYGTGNVGIGSSTPANRLEINAPNVADGVNLYGAGPAYFLSDANKNQQAALGVAASSGQYSTDAATGDVVLRSSGRERLLLQNGYGASGLALSSNFVGIGRANPGFPLSFPDTLGDKISLWGDSGNHFGFGIAPATLQIFTDLSASDIVFGHGQSTNLTETMRIKGNGLVGIGTATPGVPLDVVGYDNANIPQYGFLNSSSPTGTAPAQSVAISIRASQRIIALEFDAVSDRRTKDIIGQSDRQADLEVIQKLRVTDYRRKDRVANGDTPCKGFIAQEVETVIPEAVTRSRQFVPDIYAAASGAKFDPAAKTVAVKLAKAHGLKAGDRVRLMTEAGQMDLTVSSVPSEQEFVAANCEKDPKQVFVFGKEVSDFRTLNYDRIFTTGISAMQELARRVTALEAHEAERVALEKRAAQVEELEQEVADLKAVVVRLAENQHEAGARRVSGQHAMSEQSGVLVTADNAGGVSQQHSTAQPAE